MRLTWFCVLVLVAALYLRFISQFYFTVAIFLCAIFHRSDHLAVLMVGLLAAVDSLIISALCLVLYGVLIIDWSSFLIILRTLPRDLRFLTRALNSLIRVKYLGLKNATVAGEFQKSARRFPEKKLFYYEDQIWTFHEVDELSNQIGNTFMEMGYKKGDVVALLMSNCPTYIATWLGLAKIGVVTALINTNLRNESLAHCIKVGRAKCLLHTPEFEGAVAEISEQLTGVVKVQYGQEAGNGVIGLDVALQRASKQEPIPKEPLNHRDPILYIYTSGTTGLPKAAIITNVKCLMLGYASWYVLNFNQEDILYNSLPLYHTSGGILGIMPALLMGYGVVIRKKFSASQYFTDCIKYKCSLGLYIGEMCRYLLAQPERSSDADHKLRIMLGNGMRPTVWRSFQQRFNVPQICELYGSTEGNTNLINIDKTVGAVGFLPQCIPKRFLPIDLIRVDDSGAPIRGPDGLCVRCKPGEPGTFVGVISTMNSSQEFAGYVGGASENQKKIMNDVFNFGDKVFCSGDLLVKDESGYLYFRDRLGDTYRWKGENVSATEVEAIVSRAAGNMMDVTVYGVEVGNLEGRCGMAAIVDSNSQLDLDALTKEMDKCLPTYARPYFIRITREVNMTATFKLKKTELQREGFNPAVVKDPLYFRKGDRYIPLTPDLYQNLIAGIERI